MDPTGTLIFAALLGLIPAFIAKYKGRSFGLWWFYGFMIWIIAIIHVLIIKTTPEALQKKVDKDPLIKKCPYCSEIIKADALICKHCHMDLRKFKPIQDSEIIELTNEPTGT